MARLPYTPGSSPQQPQLLEHCLALDCDIDPLILRARLLHQQGRNRLARALEQEVMPLF
ncbi:hypothetical protein [Synechococcus sp. UW140]|uniref:hypothetical protein n=1 Tax=Synechococcus sp. UW140 TaxID=368503 RepID=UPI0014830BF5|nr:hypothetical protein [Synechococcus sp. UW140]